MKYAFKCPRCGGEKIYAVKQASLPSCHDPRQTRPLTIAATGWNVLQPSMLAALLEARVCDRCGLTELYTKNTDALAVMAELDVGQVRFYDAEAEALEEADALAGQGRAGEDAAIDPGVLDVLVVAGDEAIAAEARAALVERAHRVFEASSADQARTLGQGGGRFDVLVVACDLERAREGLLLADELLEAAVVRRVVVLLARSDIGDAMRARDLGAFVRLGRPDTSDQLVVAVEHEEPEG